MDDKKLLATQRVCMILVAALGIVVGYFGSSIVAIMEDVSAPSNAALVPIFCGLFFWRKKMNSTGTLITIATLEKIGCIGIIVRYRPAAVEPG